MLRIPYSSVSPSELFYFILFSLLFFWAVVRLGGKSRGAGKGFCAAKLAKAKSLTHTHTSEQQKQQQQQTYENDPRSNEKTHSFILGVRVCLCTMPVQNKINAIIQFGYIISLYFDCFNHFEFEFRLRRSILHRSPPAALELWVFVRRICYWYIGTRETERERESECGEGKECESSQAQLNLRRFLRT